MFSGYVTYHPTCIYDVLIGGTQAGLSPAIRKAQDLVPLTASHPPPAAGKATLRPGAELRVPSGMAGPQKLPAWEAGAPHQGGEWQEQGSEQDHAPSTQAGPPDPKD